MPWKGGNLACSSFQEWFLKWKAAAAGLKKDGVSDGSGGYKKGWYQVGVGRLVHGNQILLKDWLKFLISDRSCVSNILPPSIGGRHRLLLFMTNPKIPNMKKHSREICFLFTLVLSDIFESCYLCWDLFSKSAHRKLIGDIFKFYILHISNTVLNLGIGKFHDRVLIQLIITYLIITRPFKTHDWIY